MYVLWEAIGRVESCSSSSLADRHFLPGPLEAVLVQMWVTNHAHQEQLAEPLREQERKACLETRNQLVSLLLLQGWCTATLHHKSCKSSCQADDTCKNNSIHCCFRHDRRQKKAWDCFYIRNSQPYKRTSESQSFCLFKTYVTVSRALNNWELSK